MRIAIIDRADMDAEEARVYARREGSQDRPLPLSQKFLPREV